MNTEERLALINNLPEHHFTERNRLRLLDWVKTLDKHGHATFIEDVIPTIPQFKAFYDEVKHKYKGIIFVTQHNPKWSLPSTVAGFDSYNVFSRLSIVYADAPDLEVGQLSVEKTSEGKIVYCVQSPRIRNDRYATYNDNYHMKKSTNFKTAVKTALENLKPFSVRQLMEDHEHSLNSAQSQITQPANSRLYDAMTIGCWDVQEEVEAMMLSGYTPKTPRFQKAMQLLVEHGEELKRLSRYKPKGTFVWLKPTQIEYIEEGGTPVVIDNVDEVPEDIRNKIAVLQIGANGSAIIEVGMKIDDTKYWVFQ
jgi:hypothetical protein